ncbi:hypothetical protein COT42_04395 [Candidatus Saganbacteria bacterium CG08_land_8_20_14_0_20_45_16]|uniref:Fibronectin type-III domain-containing protein n=1 Tax=Candidatus Saganbacteria bacterium CG08_land_8_20_14_0_20_45_16 TaxID=2014293 RepID=A0A2H0XXV8_UNCSA|nr:MAG: hypothetical protein COT42_04395 [Candidatus Saganbacteria bacterium CG08_land_8_20_14_0_20_45_16]
MRKIILATFLVLASLVFFISPSFAAASVYYVDAGSGSDSNDGSSGSPWKTITHASLLSVSGDTVNVASGTYNTDNGEIFPINVNGAYFVATLQYGPVVIEDSGATRVFNMSTGAKLDGFYVKGVAGNEIIGVAANSVQVLNCYVSAEGYSYGIYCDRSPHPSGLTIEANIIERQTYNSGTFGVHLEGLYGAYNVTQNEISNFGTGIYDSQCANSWTGIIDRNTIIKCLYGIYFYYSNHTIANVTNNIICSNPQLNGQLTGLYRSGSVGVYKSGGGLTVNSSYNCSWNNQADWSGVTQGTGDISIYPGFTTPEANSYNLQLSNSGWTNPCINTASDGGNRGCFASQEAGVPYCTESYVSGTGDDTNLGTEVSPWRNITYALTRTIRTVNVLAGTYSAGGGLETSFPIYLANRYIKGVSRDTVTVNAGAANAFYLYANASLEGVMVRGTSGTTVISILAAGTYLKNNYVSAEGYTNGIYFDWGAHVSSVTLEGNLIERQTYSASTYGVYMQGMYGPYNIIQNEVSNFGTGIFDNQSSQSWTGIIDRNTIIKCLYGIYFYYCNTYTPIVKNNIVCSEPRSGQSPINGSCGIYRYNGNLTVNSSYNDSWNNLSNWSGVSLGTGDITVDPSFVNASAYDYHLSPGSPCIATGTPAGTDMGAYDYVDSTPPVVVLGAPDGGETLMGGDSTNITWSASDDTAVTSVNLRYSTDSGASWVEIATGEDNDGTYSWNPIPSLDITTARVSVEALDAIGNIGTDMSDADFTIDSTGPQITNVTSSLDDGMYGLGNLIPITITFDEATIVNTDGGTPYIDLDTGGIAEYASGSGGTDLIFNYTVGAGEESPELAYMSLSIELNSGTIKDAAGNNADVTLLVEGDPGSLTDNKNLEIDGIVPEIMSGAMSADNTYVTVNFDNSVFSANDGTGVLDASDFAIHFEPGSGTATDATIAGIADVDNNPLGEGPTQVRVNLSVTGTIKGGDGNETVEITPADSAIYDFAGNVADVSTTTMPLTFYDLIAPTVTTVSATTANGAYNEGDTINITVTFDDNVTVSTKNGTPTLLLETGDTDRTATYTEGSDTDTLTFDYTVQAEDTSSDLDYVSNGSLALNEGTITDGSSNNANLTLPEPGAAGSLGDNKAIVIDTTAPTAPEISSPSESERVGDNTPTIAWTAGTDIGGSGILSNEVTVDTGVTTLGAVTEYTAEALVDGLHTVEVRAMDVAGNWGSKSTATSFTVDTAAPGVSSLTSPADESLTPDNTPTLSWGSVDGAITYEARVDSEIVATTESTNFTTGTLSDALHTWEVRAIDIAGNPSDWSSSRTLTVDTTNPSAPSLTSPPDEATTGDNTPLLTWDAATDTNGIASYEITVDTTVTTQDATTSFTTGTLSDSLHTWEARAKDNAGNWGVSSGTRIFTIDTTAPNVPSLILPTNGSSTRDNTPTLSWGSVADAVTYEARVDGVIVATTEGTDFTTNALSDDLHTWEARCRDLLSNTCAWSSSWTFTVDTAGPAGTGLILKDRTSNNTTYTNERTVSVEASGIVGSPTQMMLSESFSFTGGSWVSFANPTTYALAVGADGARTVYYKTQDAVFNVSSTLNDSIILDTTGPSAPNLGTPTNNNYTNNTTPSFTWEAASDTLSGVASYEITVNSVTQVATLSGLSYTVAALSEGLHTWKVRTRDNMENWGTDSTTFNVTIDASAPTVTLISPEGDELIAGNGPSYTISWSASDTYGLATNPISLYLTTDTGSSWSEIASGLANSGSYGWVVPEVDSTRCQVRVAAIDLAGNIATTESGRFDIDSSAPSVSSFETTVSVSGSAITFTFSEAVDRDSVEAAFSIVPSVTGSFTWSAGDTRMTFTPTTEFVAGTMYSVTISRDARDLAGNRLDTVDNRSFVIGSVSADSVPPTITIRNEIGETVSTGDAISQDPIFVISFTDSTSIAASSIRITLDTTLLSYIASSGATATAMTGYASTIDLASGLHNLTVQVADTLGNTRTKEVTGLRVAGEADPPEATRITVMHSLPGAAGAAASATQGGIVAYNLNKDANITLYMYGLGGEMVTTRKFSSGTSGAKAGYNQLSISGVSDLSGAALANGIYVFKIVSDGRVVGKGKFVVYH